MPEAEHLLAYVCERALNGSPVLLVSREDGEWCFLCEDRVHDREDDEAHAVGLNHMFEMDPSLGSLTTMVDDEVAYRPSVESAWCRSIVEFEDE